MSTSRASTQFAAWTRSSLSPCLPYTSMPAYAAIPLFPCLFYLRFWTIALAFIITMVIWYMSRKGYTLNWFVQRIKGMLAGNRYSSRPTIYVRRMSRRYWDEY